MLLILPDSESHIPVKNGYIFALNEIINAYSFLHNI